MCAQTNTHAHQRHTNKQTEKEAKTPNRQTKKEADTKQANGER